MAASGKVTTDIKGTGTIQRVAGPVVTAIGLKPRMYDVMLVGPSSSWGKSSRSSGRRRSSSVYEETSRIGLANRWRTPASRSRSSWAPDCSAASTTGCSARSRSSSTSWGTSSCAGVRAPGLSREKQWGFKPAVEEGQGVRGASPGTVQEAKKRRASRPRPSRRDRKDRSHPVREHEGDDVVAELDGGRKLMMKQDWPVRQPRPTKNG